MSVVSLAALPVHPASGTLSPNQRRLLRALRAEYEPCRFREAERRLFTTIIKRARKDQDHGYFWSRDFEAHAATLRVRAELLRDRLIAEGRLCLHDHWLKALAWEDGWCLAVYHYLRGAGVLARRAVRQSSFNPSKFVVAWPRNRPLPPAGVPLSDWEAYLKSYLGEAETQ